MTQCFKLLSDTIWKPSIHYPYHQGPIWRQLKSYSQRPSNCDIYTMISANYAIGITVTPRKQGPGVWTDQTVVYWRLQMWTGPQFGTLLSSTWDSKIWWLGYCTGLIGGAGLCRNTFWVLTLLRVHCEIRAEEIWK